MLGDTSTAGHSLTWVQALWQVSCFERLKLSMYQGDTRVALSLATHRVSSTTTYLCSRWSFGYLCSEVNYAKDMTIHL
jgi:hypothetical protein